MASSNNGFLCINIKDKESYTYGEITDCDDNLVCGGVIMPKYNPEKEELISYLPDLKYYSPVLRGKELRLYKYGGYIQISSVEEIYPEKYLKMMETSGIYKGQIDYDLIKDDYVYYFVMTPTELVLTHLAPIYADHFSGIEENIRLVDEDQAFIHHLPYNIFSDEVTLEDLNILLDEYVSFENGINLYQVYYFPSYIQIWSKSYSLYKSFEKPDGLSIYKYYFMTLNKYYKDINNVIEDDDQLLGIGFKTDSDSDSDYDYWSSLLCDINSFVKYYPEYEIECSKITNGLMEYVGNDIKKLDYLMSLDYNEALGLITPIPSRRGSFI
jgi:hypothetical protein